MVPVQPQRHHRGGPCGYPAQGAGGKATAVCPASREDCHRLQDPRAPGIASLGNTAADQQIPRTWGCRRLPPPVQWVGNRGELATRSVVRLLSQDKCRPPPWEACARCVLRSLG